MLNYQTIIENLSEYLKREGNDETLSVLHTLIEEEENQLHTILDDLEREYIESIMEEEYQSQQDEEIGYFSSTKSPVRYYFDGGAYPVAFIPKNEGIYE